MLNKGILIRLSTVLALLAGCTTHMETTGMENNMPNTTAHKGENRTDIVTASINVVVENQEITTYLSFKNKSKTESVYLAKYRGASNQKMMTNFFQVSSNNKKISYIGMTAKIKPTVNDFIELHPLETLNFSVRIDESYAFLNGTNNYEIKYRAYHEYPSLGDPVNSDVVKFQYTK